MKSLKLLVVGALAASSAARARADDNTVKIGV